MIYFRQLLRRWLLPTEQRIALIKEGNECLERAAVAADEMAAKWDAEALHHLKSSQQREAWWGFKRRAMGCREVAAAVRAMKVEEK